MKETATANARKPTATFSQTDAEAHEGEPARRRKPDPEEHGQSSHSDPETDTAKQAGTPAEEEDRSDGSHTNPGAQETETATLHTEEEERKCSAPDPTFNAPVVLAHRKTRAGRPREE